jgi:hypothetical protein
MLEVFQHARVSPKETDNRRAAVSVPIADHGDCRRPRVSGDVFQSGGEAGSYHLVTWQQRENGEEYDAEPCCQFKQDHHPTRRSCPRRRPRAPQSSTPRWEDGDHLRLRRDTGSARGMDVCQVGIRSCRNPKTFGQESARASFPQPPVIDRDVMLSRASPAHGAFPRWLIGGATGP